MLSVLIPVYNFGVSDLVRVLSRQGIRLGVAFEILCFDDGSAVSWRRLHREVLRFEGVVYREMPNNLGRSAIRNRLAAAAQFPNLLFLDNDARVPDPRFLERYLQHLQPGAVLYGGRIYDHQPPEDGRLRLHWHFGRRREQRTAAQRRRQPYQSFMTNNFLIPRDLFLSIGFDERLQGYGHEDTIFGLELQNRGVPILHLDNPLEHIGLEPADVFIAKNKQAIKNLKFLARRHPLIDTRLLRTCRKLEGWGMDRPLAKVLRAMLPLMEHQLRRGASNLRLFDLCKLGWMLSEGE